MKQQTLNLYDRRVKYDSFSITRIGHKDGDYVTTIPVKSVGPVQFYKNPHGTYHFLHPSGYSFFELSNVKINTVIKVAKHPLIKRMMKKDYESACRMGLSIANLYAGLYNERLISHIPLWAKMKSSQPRCKR